jgi:hypothetical protein
VLAHFRVNAPATCYWGEIVQRASRKLLLIYFAGIGISGAISPGIFPFSELIGMPAENGKNVMREELKLTLFSFMVLMGLKRFLYQFIKRTGGLCDSCIDIIGSDRQVIFFGIVLRHTAALLMTRVR